MARKSAAQRKGEAASPSVAQHSFNFWRSSDRKAVVPMVEIPRALALDLVRVLNPWTFGAEASWEDCDAGLHERRAEAHRERMEDLGDMISMDLSDQGIEPTAENMLRVLAIAYEASGILGKTGVA